MRKFGFDLQKLGKKNTKKHQKACKNQKPWSTFGGAYTGTASGGTTTAYTFCWTVGTITASS